jgi:hypothetical protein
MRISHIAGVCALALAGCDANSASAPQNELLGKWAVRASGVCSGGEPYLMIGDQDVFAYAGEKKSLLYGDVSYEQTMGGAEPRWLLRYTAQVDGSAQGIEFKLDQSGDLIATSHLAPGGGSLPAEGRDALRLYKCRA